jgi:hypothetical protein
MSGASGPAVALEYLGPSDKPVLPIVVSASPLPETALKSLLSTNVDLALAQYVLLPEPDVIALAERCAERLRSISSDSNISNAVLRVAVVTNGAVSGESRTADPFVELLGVAEARSVLDVLDLFRSKDASANRRLAEAVAVFRKRTQLTRKL